MLIDPKKTFAVVDNQRKTYYQPYLTELGELRTLTMGGSPGFGDSGSGTGCEMLGIGGSGKCNPIP
jgi:hypothetical protein